jgi:photosystem II stability/assembly factor-like uncharacterized protein
VTDHRDPIEAWLSADVEPLSPQPGTFERVHRRARRRKAVRTISAAAGAAVIVAAAATLPQVASGLLTGPTNLNRYPASTSPSTSKAGSFKSQAPTESGRALRGHGPPLSNAGTGQAPASNFRPASVTFVNNSVGAVLGQAGSCGSRPCMVMAGTPDYGRRWTKIGAPPAGPPDASSGVSQVRFLDASNGWAYGPALYATHDGGRTWRRINHQGRVLDLSTVGTRVFAVIGSGCTSTGPDFGTGCTGFALYSAAARSRQWQAVTAASGTGQAAPGGLQLRGDRGFLVASGRLYAGPVSAGAWHPVPAAPPAAPPCLIRSSARGPWLLAPAARAVYLVCRSSPPTARLKLALYISPDNGRTWQAKGAAPAAATSLAVSPGGSLVLATSAGIYFSRDARTWQVANLTGTAPSGGFRFVGMTTSANGVAVPANPALHEIFITRDGGQTWRPSVIR